MLRKDPLSENPFHMLTDNKNTKGEKKKEYKGCTSKGHEGEIIEIPDAGSEREH